MSGWGSQPWGMFAWGVPVSHNAAAAFSDFPATNGSTLTMHNAAPAFSGFPATNGSDLSIHNAAPAFAGVPATNGSTTPALADYGAIYYWVRDLLGRDADSLPNLALNQYAAIIVPALLARYGQYPCISSSYAGISPASKNFFDQAAALLIAALVQQYESAATVTTGGTGAIKSESQGDVTIQYDVGTATVATTSWGDLRSAAWDMFLLMGCIPVTDRDAAIFGEGPASRKMQVLRPTRGLVSGPCPYWRR